MNHETDPPRSADGPPNSPNAANPFAPVQEVVNPDQTQGPGYVDLPTEFWLVAIGSFVLGLFLLAVLPGLGVILLFGVIFGTIRVPFVQRQLSQTYPDRPLPNAIACLATSSLFSVFIGAAATFAFVLICLPGGLGLYAVVGDQGTVGEAVFPLLIGVSGLIALFVFFFLYRLSFRWPI